MQKIILALISLFIFLLIVSAGCVEEPVIPSNTITINGIGDYATIHQAYAAADEGDTIFLPEGTFDGGLQLNKTVNIIGAGPGKTILTDGQREAVLIVSSTDCMIKQLSIVSSNPVVHGIQCEENSNTFREIDISNTFYGVYYFSNSNQNIFTEINIDNCSFGFFIRFSEYNEISSCSVETIEYYGIYLLDSPNNQVDNSQFTNSQEYGMFIDGDKSEYNTINNCKFTNNFYGMRIKKVTNCTFFKNTFDSNDHGIYLCCGSLNNTFTQNIFLDNLIQVIDPLGNIWYKDMLGNYWGDYTEKFPTATNDGIIWDTPYIINGTIAQDLYPLVHSPSLE